MEERCDHYNHTPEENRRCVLELGHEGEHDFQPYDWLPGH